MDHLPPTSEILLRLGLAVLFGLIVGYDRESHGRTAGLRTTMLTCVSACVAMILSNLLYADVHLADWRPDPARLAAGVLTGMGFLGAGTIIRDGTSIRGVTTAAVLWYVTILGLALGAGAYTLAGVGAAIAIAALFIISPLETLIVTEWYGVVTVVLDSAGPGDEEVRRTIDATGVRVKKMGLHYMLPEGRRTLRCEVMYKKADLFDASQRVVAALKAREGVVEVDWA